MRAQDDDRLASLERRLLVIEQLMFTAALDPDGRPFTGPDAASFYQGVGELIRAVRRELRPAEQSERVVSLRPR